MTKGEKNTPSPHCFLTFFYVFYINILNFEFSGKSLGEAGVGWWGRGEGASELRQVRSGFRKHSIILFIYFYYYYFFFFFFFFFFFLLISPVTLVSL